MPKKFLYRVDLRANLNNADYLEPIKDSKLVLKLKLLCHYCGCESDPLTLSSVLVPYKKERVNLIHECANCQTRCGTVKVIGLDSRNNVVGGREVYGLDTHLVNGMTVGFVGLEVQGLFPKLDYLEFGFTWAAYNVDDALVEKLWDTHQQGSTEEPGMKEELCTSGSFALRRTGDVTDDGIAFFAPVSDVPWEGKVFASVWAYFTDLGKV